MNNAENIQRQFANMGPPPDSTEGVVVEQDWDNGFVLVNFGGTEQRMKWALGAPWPGDKVRKVSLGGAVFCIPVWGAPLGTVITTAAGFATVLGDDSKTYSYPHVGGAPANGARVRLDHGGRGVPSGTYSVEPANSEFIPPPPPPPPSGGGAGGRQVWFHPSWSGNWNPGFQDPSVTVSSSRTGFYGYGTQIADTIPDSAVLTVCQLHLSKTWESGSTTGVSTSMGLHGFNGPPGSASSGDLFGSYSFGPNETVINLLGAFADALKVGSALGVGFRSGSNGWRTYAPAPVSGRIFAAWA